MQYFEQHHNTTITFIFQKFVSITPHTQSAPAFFLKKKRLKTSFASKFHIALFNFFATFFSIKEFFLVLLLLGRLWSQQAGRHLSKSLVGIFFFLLRWVNNNGDVVFHSRVLNVMITRLFFQFSLSYFIHCYSIASRRTLFPHRNAHTHTHTFQVSLPPSCMQYNRVCAHWSTGAVVRVRENFIRQSSSQYEE